MGKKIPHGLVRLSDGDYVNIDEERRKRDRKREIAKIRDLDQKKKKDNSGIIASILGVILCFLLVASILRHDNGLAPPTFSGFLQMLQELPDINIPLFSSVVDLTGNWGIFNFIQPFIRALSLVFDFFVFLVNGLVSIVTYAFYLLKFFIGY